MGRLTEKVGRLVKKGERLVESDEWLEGIGWE